MPARKRILVVEPAGETANEIAFHLRQDGYEVTVCRTAGEAIDELARRGAALIATAHALPDMLGTDLLKRVRRTPRGSTLPVIVTGGTHDEVDRVVAFELGVDDYVASPFSVRELALRVRAILRRAEPLRAPPKPEVLTIGPLEIDVARHRATVDGREVSLTPLELRLLAHLASLPGRVHTRESLLARVWESSGPSEDTRAVDTSIKRLRRKLGPAAAWIETVRGVGYRLRDQGPERACG